MVQGQPGRGQSQDHEGGLHQGAEKPLATGAASAADVLRRGVRDTAEVTAELPQDRRRRCEGAARALLPGTQEIRRTKPPSCKSVGQFFDRSWPDERDWGHTDQRRLVS